VRVFLDTNVLVSAFASRGLCADLLEVVLAEHDLVVGRNVLRELAKALREKVGLPAPRADEIVGFVAREAVQIVEGAGPARARADQDDRLVLGEAIGGRAASFVTGDGALLDLGTVEGLPILSPRQLWETLRAP
jgi:putative PIN family toxin of toxin-antitoxin system